MRTTRGDEFFRKVNVLKAKERLRQCSRFKEADTWQLNAIQTPDQPVVSRCPKGQDRINSQMRNTVN